MSGDPYSKERQLARGARRYKRKVASPKQWQANISAKQGPCRVCTSPEHNGSGFGIVQLHHLIPRARGGDDVADNLVPLCSNCHDMVTRRLVHAVKRLSKSLSEAERAYMVTKLGEALKP